MRVHYYNRQAKYYTGYKNAQRKAVAALRLVGYVAVGLAVYAFLYLVLVASGAPY